MILRMPREKVLITVKTYPTLSVTYNELVCTAGFREDGSWVRIYPVPFKNLDLNSQYKKYDWIELELVKNTSDFRPESYRPYDPGRIEVGVHLDADGGSWDERRRVCLKNVYNDLTKLISDAKSIRKTSLATFKPLRVTDFIIEQTDRDWDAEKLKKLNIAARQGDLFSPEKSADTIFKLARKLPYKFSYKFTDVNGRESSLSIIDWEVGALYWNALERRNGNESLAVLDVKQKYFNDIVLTKDVYLFLGTTLEYHNLAPNPFVVIGVFYPKPISQLQLPL